MGSFLSSLKNWAIRNFPSYGSKILRHKMEGLQKDRELLEKEREQEDRLLQRIREKLQTDGKRMNRSQLLAEFRAGQNALKLIQSYDQSLAVIAQAEAAASQALQQTRLQSIPEHFQRTMHIASVVLDNSAMQTMDQDVGVGSRIVDALAIIDSKTDEMLKTAAPAGTDSLASSALTAENILRLLSASNATAAAAAVDAAPSVAVVPMGPSTSSDAAVVPSVAGGVNIESLFVPAALPPPQLMQQPVAGPSGGGSNANVPAKRKFIVLNG